MTDKIFSLTGGRTLSVPDGRPVSPGEIMRGQIIAYINARAEAARKLALDDAVTLAALAGDLQARLDEPDAAVAA